MKRSDINFLKSIAIIAVVLFHMELLTNGYLGVDIFLVVAGYLTTKSLIKKAKDNSLNYKDYIIDRIIRLMPVLLVGTLLTLLIPYLVGMLPDNYENIAETVVASNLFSNNILSALITNNYWDIANNYKPLYHLWYLGILFEFYIIYPLLVKAIKRFSSKTTFEKNLKLSLLGISIVSLILYLIPSIPSSYKFYYLPFRLFEFCIGGLCFFSSIKLKKDYRNYLGIAARIILLLLLVATSSIISGELNLILVVFLTSVILLLNNQFNVGAKIWNYIGEKTYSIYIWHQIIFAFYRCYISRIESFASIAQTLLLVVVISLLSFYLIEKRISTKHVGFIVIILLVVDLVITLSALKVYMNAGVVRDIPELDISVDNISRGMHAKYCDRLYQYNKKFEENGRINILLIGNSFARDFGNILLESTYKDKVNIQYHFDYTDLDKNEILKSDFVFIYGKKKDIPNIITNNISSEKIFGIGVKNFGESNEMFYARRNTKGYYDQTVFPTDDILEMNQNYALEWQDKYIDFLKILQNEDGSVNVFTDNHKFISQDCRHLTQNGAFYLSKLIDWSSIFEFNYQG